MITREQIYKASPDELSQFHNDLLIERMKMDKICSTFLDETEMSEERDDSPEWKRYVELTAQYSEILALINTITFYRNRHVATCI